MNEKQEKILKTCSNCAYASENEDMPYSESACNGCGSFSNWCKCESVEE